MNANVFAIASVGAALVASVYVILGNPFGQTSKKKRGKKTCVGLVNLGNSCFLNATLQALAPCIRMQSWLRNSHSSEKIHNKHLLEAMAFVLKVLNREEHWTQSVLTPTCVVDALRRHGWSITRDQQDAHEMFHVLMETLDEEEHSKLPGALSLFDVSFLKDDEVTDTEMKAVGRSVPTLPTNTGSGGSESPFRGLLTNQLICRACGRKSAVTFQNFDTISLALPDHFIGTLDVQQLFRQFVCSERVGGVECEGCQVKHASEVPVHSPAIKRMAIGKAPTCLCIHIPRCTMTPTGIPIKRSDNVIFEETLDLRPFLYYGAPIVSDVTTKKLSLLGGCQPTCRTDNGNLQSVSSTLLLPVPSLPPFLPSSSRLYRLVSVVEHLGCADSGHFVTYRRAPTGGVTPHQRNTWLRTSDTKVEEVSLDTVLESEAYMLFYERC